MPPWQPHSEEVLTKRLNEKSEKRGELEMAGSVSSEDGDVGFQIAPMVDVVFVIMLFFMASAGVQVTETNLGLSLPSGGGASSGPAVPQIVRIREDSTVQFQNAVLDTAKDRDLPTLTQRLTEIIAKQPTTPIIIQPSPMTPHQRVVDVLNAASRAGVKNLTFG